MTSPSTIAEQRDRFLAFAFAAADILIEVDDDGRIIFATGTVNAILGLSEDDLLGMDFSALADDADAVLAEEYLYRLRRAQRAREPVIHFKGANGKPAALAISGMSNPARIGVHHLVLRRASPLTQRTEQLAGMPTIPSKEFAALSASHARDARNASDPLNLTMYDMDWTEIETVIGQAEAEGLSEELVQIMRAWAYEGTGIGHITSGKYSVLLEDTVDPEHLADRLRTATSERAPDADPQIEHTALPLDYLSDTEEFESFFNKAMQIFDEMGADAFGDMTPDDIVNAVLPEPHDDDKPVAGSKEPQRPAHLQPTRTNVKRKGTTESWG